VCRLLQVLGRMKQAMVEHSSSASHSFLLDDDSTLPFVANDILAQMDDKVRAIQLLHRWIILLMLLCCESSAGVYALWHRWMTRCATCVRTIFWLCRTWIKTPSGCHLNV
jgi:hypothetical protein